MDPSSSGRPWRLLAACFAIAVAIGGVAYALVNRQMPQDDELRYLHMASHHVQGLRALLGGDLERAYEGMLEASPTHPPGFTLLMVPFRTLPFEPRIEGLLLMAALAGLAVWLCFVLASQILEPDAGLLAAALFGSFPLSVFLFHRVMTEAPLCVAVLLTLLCSWRSEAFTRRGWSLAAGLSAGFGLLVKWTFPIFVLGPCVVMVTASSRRAWKRTGYGIALATLLAAAVAAPWYLAHLPEVWEFARFNEESRAWSPEVGGVAPSWYLFYLRHADLQLGLVAALLGAAALLLSWRLGWRRAAFLWSWLLPAYLLFSSLATKEAMGRHLLPAFPAIAILIGGMVGSIRHAVWRKMAIVTLGLVFAGITLLMPWRLLPDVQWHTPLGRLAVLHAPPSLDNRVDPWHVREVLAAMAQDSSGQTGRRALCFGGHFEANNWLFHNTAKWSHHPVHFTLPPVHVSLENPWHTHLGLESFWDLDYLVLIRPNPTWHPVRRFAGALGEALQRDAADYLAAFDRLSRWPVPGDAHIEVWARRRASSSRENLLLLWAAIALDPDAPELWRKLSSVLDEMGADQQRDEAARIADAIESHALAPSEVSLADFDLPVEVDRREVPPRLGEGDEKR